MKTIRESKTYTISKNCTLVYNLVDDEDCQSIELIFHHNNNNYNFEMEETKEYKRIINKFLTNENKK